MIFMNISDGASLISIHGRYAVKVWISSTTKSSWIEPLWSNTVRAIPSYSIEIWWLFRPHKRLKVNFFVVANTELQYVVPKKFKIMISSLWSYSRRLFVSCNQDILKRTDAAHGWNWEGNFAAYPKSFPCFRMNCNSTNIFVKRIH